MKTDSPYDRGDIHINKAIIYYFTQQNKSATAVIVVVVTNILI